MPGFDFNAWRDQGRPIPWCKKDRKHTMLDLDPTRPIGLKCAQCGADCEFLTEKAGDGGKQVFVEPV